MPSLNTRLASSAAELSRCLTPRWTVSVSKWLLSVATDSCSRHDVVPVRAVPLAHGLRCTCHRSTPCGTCRFVPSITVVPCSCYVAPAVRAWLYSPLWHDLLSLFDETNNASAARVPEKPNPFTPCKAAFRPPGDTAGEETVVK